jgi:hypothetical protein
MGASDGQGRFESAWNWIREYLFPKERNPQEAPIIQEVETPPKPLLFGIEQEIFINRKTKDGYKTPNEEDLLDKIKQLSPGWITDRFWPCEYWIPEGLFYVDGSQTPEIASYPIPAGKKCVQETLKSINSGRMFMLKLGNAFYGRKAFVKGWTMHYNFGVSNHNDDKRPHNIVPLLMYFFNHPWSSASGEPDDKYAGNFSRWELGFDYMENLVQVKLGLAIATAYMYGEPTHRFPRLEQFSRLDVQKKGFESVLQTEYGPMKLKEYLKKFLESYEPSLVEYANSGILQEFNNVLQGRFMTSIERLGKSYRRHNELWKDYAINEAVYRVRPNAMDAARTRPAMNRILLAERQKEIDHITWNGVVNKTGEKKLFYELVVPQA